MCILITRVNKCMEKVSTISSVPNLTHKSPKSMHDDAKTGHTF